MLPFFIVGAPRTGTTLLRRILTANAVVAIPSESLFIAEYLRAEQVPLAERTRLFLRDPDLEAWGASWPADVFDGLSSMADVVRRAHEVFAEQNNARVWGQKTPRLVRQWETLGERFPNARFIHAVREPRAVVASLKRSKAHQLNVLVGSRRWRDDTRRGLQMEAGLGERVFQCRYEELVGAPEAVVQRICDFLELTYEPAMLEVPEQKLTLHESEDRAGHHVRVAEPISAASGERWKKDLSANEQRVVVAVTHEVARDAGYALPNAAAVTRAERLRFGAMHALTAAQKVAQAVSTAELTLRRANRHMRLGSIGRVIAELAGGRPPA